MTEQDPLGRSLATPRHPIQVVVARTGLAADRIRQWERRYQVVVPSRSEGGHRLYTDQDVERLRLLARAVKAGRRIGDVASMSTGQLSRLTEEDVAEAVDAGSSRALGEDDLAKFIEACSERINRLDAAGLESILTRAAATLGLSEFVTNAVDPLLDRIGADWEGGLISPPHEHLASAVVGQVLTRLTNNARPNGDAPTLLVATPQGAAHALGAQMVAALAAGAGWAVVYLGSDLPGRDLAAAAERAGVRAVALSIVFPPNDPDVGADLRELASAIPPEVTLIIGGRAAHSYRSVLDERPWHAPTDLAAFVHTLASLN